MVHSEYYEELGIPTSATEAEIKKAFVVVLFFIIINHLCELIPIMPDYYEFTLNMHSNMQYILFNLIHSF